MLTKKHIKTHENELRQAVTDEAKKWLGAKYHINGFIPYQWCDCHTILMMVFAEVGLIKPIKPNFYRPDFSFHSIEETYLKGIQKYGKEVKTKKAGDVILYKFANVIDHAAIVIDEDGLMIDSCISRGVTYQDYNQEVNKCREVAVYSFWGK